LDINGCGKGKKGGGLVPSKTSTKETGEICEGVYYRSKQGTEKEEFFSQDQGVKKAPRFLRKRKKSFTKRKSAMGSARTKEQRRGPKGRKNQGKRGELGGGPRRGLLEGETLGKKNAHKEPKRCKDSQTLRLGSKEGKTAWGGAKT